MSFWNPLTKSPISLADLENADEDTQLEVMKAWFFDHYEDPAESTPYETKEGGYIYIWGGPFNAFEILIEKFDGIVPEKVIEELATDLAGISTEWTGIADSQDLEEYVAKTVVLDSRFHSTFQTSISYVEILLNSEVNIFAEPRFYRMLFANVITALETYLSDAFINTVLKEEKHVRRLVESDPYFKEKKFSVSELFQKHDIIANEAKEYLWTISWHNLVKAKELYKGTFDIEFPKELGKLINAVLKRHDIIHRNGKTKENEDVRVFKKDVLDLIAEVRNFVSIVDKKVSIIRGHIVSN